MAYVNGAVDTPIFGLANSDAHNTGDPDSDVGVAKNGAYLKEKKKRQLLTARNLYKAIKAGRTFATTGPSLALDVNGELMGDTAYVFDGTANVNLSVDSESPTAILVKIDIVKNHLMKHHHYCEVCAGDVLTYVAGILAREEPES